MERQGKKISSTVFFSEAKATLGGDVACTKIKKESVSEKKHFWPLKNFNKGAVSS